MTTPPVRFTPARCPELTIVIHGTGACSGKTVLQMLLAEFLDKRGHKVRISDEAHDVPDGARNKVLEDCMKHRLMDEEVLPMPVTVHVSKEPAVLPVKSIHFVR